MKDLFNTQHQQYMKIFLQHNVPSVTAIDLFGYQDQIISTEKMPPFLAFINYNGKWQSDKDYTGYKAHGIMLEDDYTFKQLLEVIAETIQLETPFDKFILKYQVSDTYPRIAITDDLSFNFYKELKKRETE
ncbi:MuDR family transposase containing protein, partial [Striga asiatica]